MMGFDCTQQAWQVLVYQQGLEFRAYALLAGIAFLLMVFGVVLCQQACKYGNTYNDGTVAAIGFGMAAIAAVVFWLAGLEAYYHWYNPEYQALMDLVREVK